MDGDGFMVPIDRNRGVGKITAEGACVVAVRRNLGNVASHSFGAVICEDVSGQTVRRCEQDGAGAPGRQILP